jgi:hypothetical protein
MPISYTLNLSMPTSGPSFVAIVDSMVHGGKPVGKRPELPRELGPIDLGRGNVAFKPGKDFAVEAAAVFLRTLLEQDVDFLGDVFERQVEHGILRGTIMEPSKINSDRIAGQLPGGLAFTARPIMRYTCALNALITSTTES